MAHRHRSAAAQTCRLHPAPRAAPCSLVSFLPHYPDRRTLQCSRVAAEASIFLHSESLSKCKVYRQVSDSKLDALRSSDLLILVSYPYSLRQGLSQIVHILKLHYTAPIPPHHCWAIHVPHRLPRDDAPSISQAPATHASASHPVVYALTDSTGCCLPAEDGHNSVCSCLVFCLLQSLR